MADNFEIIKCPACQNVMKKIFVPSKGINIDICVDGCGGIYFDKREFKHFDEQHEDATEIFKALVDKEFIPVDESNKRVCPNCGATMTKNFSSVRLEIQVDECYTCGGKFLDNKELEKIRAEYPTEEERSAEFSRNLYAIVGEEYEKQMQKNAEWEKERNEKFIKTLMRRIARTFRIPFIGR